jgi:hypothetical protein
MINQHLTKDKKLCEPCTSLVPFIVKKISKNPRFALANPLNPRSENLSNLETQQLSNSKK